MRRFEHENRHCGMRLSRRAAFGLALMLLCAGLSSALADGASAIQSVTITQEDSRRFQDCHGLPDLARIAPDERAELVEDRQVMRRMAVMGVDAEQFQTPELNWKTLYNEVWAQVGGSVLNRTNRVPFAGARVSELNQALAEAGPDAVVELTGATVEMDETLRVPGGVYVLGGGARLTPGSEKLNRAVEISGASDCGVGGLVIEGNCDYGIYVKNASRFVIQGNRVSRAGCKGLAIMGKNDGFIIADNAFFENGDGGLYLNGDVGRGVLENNAVTDNQGYDNMSAGIALSSIRIVDIDTTYNGLEDILIYDILDSPHDLVFLDNDVSRNCSSGIYSHSGYRNHYLSNAITGNEKEGICLDHGTFGCYVSQNNIRGNGNRNRMTDEALKADFVYELGRMEDGSARPKLPGVSLDNAAYNVLAFNMIAQNYGSGIKAVRSAYRNVILGNQIIDNNQGVNEPFHFFGIELSSDEKVDMQLQGFDCTPCYENIVARNMISGRHYAGVFLGAGGFVNDFFDNTIYDCTNWSMECLSTRFNSTVNNISNVVSRGINLTGTGMVQTNPQN